jgi:hypothetical protein
MWRVGVVCVVLVAGCGGDVVEEGGEPVDVGDVEGVDLSRGALEEGGAVEGVPECSALVGAIDEGVVSTGCWLAGELAFVGEFTCDDGRRVLLAGDRVGVVGGEWAPFDVDGDVGPWDLC